MNTMSQTSSTDAVPTAWLVELTAAGTAAARWVLGTEETDVGFYAEDALDAPGTDAGAAPDTGVAAWVAECLEVTGVELTKADAGRWSVWITG